MPRRSELATADTDVYFSLEDLLQLGSMVGAELLAGSGNLQKKVARTNVVEVPNLVDWVGTDELVISSGYSFREDETSLVEQLASLQKKGVVALCLKPRRFRDGLPPRVVQQAQALDFPLIQLPMAAVFANIVHESMEAILDRETLAFRHVQDRMEQLLDALWKEESPEQCLHVVEEMLGNPVMIFDSDSDLIVTPKSRALISDQMHEDLMKQLYRSGRSHSLSLNQKRHIPVHFFGVSGHSGIRIVLLEYYGPLQNLDKIILGRISHILALEMKNALSVKKLRRKYKMQFMEDWLSGRLGDALSVCVAAQAEDYHLQAEGRYRVAIVNLNTERGGVDFVQRDVNIIRNIIRNLNPDIMFYVLDGKLILVVEDRESGGSILQELATLTQKLNYIMDKGEMSFCISDPYPVQDMAEAYQQAKKISQISSRCGLREQAITYDKLGILYLLALLPEDEAVQRLRARFLGPLKDYDQKHKSALVETLRVWLDTGCNTLQTAKLLHTHYNTAVYRLAKVEKLLEMDINEVEVQLQLRIAYKLDLIL